MKKLLAPLIAVAIALASVGCKNTSPAFYSLATATAVSYGLRNSPQTANYLRAVQPVACAVASGTNLTPADVVKAIDASGIAGNSDEARAIVVAAELLYITAYDALGSRTNAAAVRPYTTAVFCDGFAAGLAGAPSVRSRNAPAVRVWWPLTKK